MLQSNIVNFSKNYLFLEGKTIEVVEYKSHISIFRALYGQARCVAVSIIYFESFIWKSLIRVQLWRHFANRCDSAWCCHGYCTITVCMFAARVPIFDWERLIYFVNCIKLHDRDIVSWNIIGEPHYKLRIIRILMCVFYLWVYKKVARSSTRCQIVSTHPRGSYENGRHSPLMRDFVALTVASSCSRLE